MHTKKHVVFLKLCLPCIEIHYTMFTMHENTNEYTINCIEVLFQIGLIETKVYEHFNKLTAFDYKFDLL